ncbi:MAG TPA: hypothetical protein VJK06_05870, partial [Methyloceanibacter sp.]|nr:hypothetical protein [Methyloceanibacter sp.]
MASTYAKEIAQLEQLINSAAKDVSADGLRTSFDLEQARRRLNELRRLAGGDLSLVRPKCASLDLGGA